ncbi:Hematopoietic prostaglandin D synthase [Holothuria leucospilota]|uniref:Hematopoietic prostaglandin D synthase n=1 Tax=Holothuria leucospilota TaxID=206669 RepID=A0A9Q1BEM0_HOLLE|nr:Hematopoietic prostaglandin D synthase [Holothuria leucospilota]
MQLYRTGMVQKELDPTCTTHCQRSVAEAYTFDVQYFRTHCSLKPLFPTKKETQMTTYKLIYFDTRGLAETARYMFALAGVEYEDHRIKNEEWPQVKKDYPLGVLPVLEVDGEQIPQSSAINHFLASEFGLLGSSNLETAKINVVYEVLVDSLNEAMKVDFADPKIKEQLKTKFYDDILETHSKFLVEILEKNNGGNGFFVGDKITLADISFLAVRRDMLAYIDKDDRLHRHPKLQALADRIAAVPQIAEWIKNRPPV